MAAVILLAPTPASWLPETVEIAIGTFYKFSVRFWAVTTISVSVP